MNETNKEKKNNYVHYRKKKKLQFNEREIFS